MDLTVIVSSAISAVAAVVGSGAIFAVRDRRRAAREQADARRIGQPSIDMEKITGAAAVLVQELQEELVLARQAAAATAAVQAQVASLSGAVTALEGRVSMLLGWIHEPDMTLPLLRRLAPLPPTGSQNGRG